jgi:hypothetical protein
VVLKSVTNTDSNKLERIQRKFAALCYNKFFYDVEHQYINMLDRLNLGSLYTRRRHIDAWFLICVFKGVKNCPSALETVGIRVTSRNICNFFAVLLLF